MKAKSVNKLKAVGMIGDIETAFLTAANLDKKHIELAAEKFVDLLADYGVGDITFKEVTGTDRYLDNAINYYLDLDSDGDACSDAIEAGSSTTATSTTNFPASAGNDSNSNGLLNNYEGTTVGTVNYTSTYTSYAITNTINACTDSDGDGVKDVNDIDDDNDGVLDVLECSPFDINNLSYLPIAYTVTNGTSASQTFPAAPDGLVVNVWTLDNSFNIKINGNHLVTPQELEFYSPTTTNSVFEFLDGTVYASVWTVNGSQSKPLIRVYIDKFGAIKVFGSKTSNGNLEEMRLRNGSFNTVTLNTNATNTFQIGQLVVGRFISQAS